ncbi:hypothetical protein AHAS_Ahas04G0107900 [Arachis hypogaea]
MLEERNPPRRRGSLAIKLEGARENDVGFEGDRGGVARGGRRAVRVARVTMELRLCFSGPPREELMGGGRPVEGENAVE